MNLNGLAGGHEFLQNDDSVRFTDFFVVPAAAKLGVFRSQLVLPRQDDLVVVGEPAALKVGVEIVDFVLGVGHTQDGKIFLDDAGSDRGVGEDGHIDIFGERCVEEARVTRFAAIG